MLVFSCPLFRNLWNKLCFSFMLDTIGIMFWISKYGYHANP